MTPPVAGPAGPPGSPHPGEAGRSAAPGSSSGWTRWLVAGAAAAWAGALLVNRSLRRVEGPSMWPTLAPGDLVLTVPTGVASWLGRPRRGDLVVARLDGVTAMKRLVGLPGDTVVLGDGHLHVDGSWWEVDRATVIDEDWRTRAGGDEAVLLGDNRPLSTDSRHVGPVPLDDVRHVVVAAVTPLRALRTPAGMRRLPGPRPREAVRVIVVGPDDRTLVFRVGDRDGGDLEWWETPGGGLHPGESTVAAAEREFAEEVGSTHGPIVDLDHVVTRESTWWGTTIERTEHHVATRATSTHVSTAGWTAGEVRDHVGWEWFTREEVLGLAAPTVPHDLAALLDRALRLV